MKQCRLCGETKPLDVFPQNKEMRDGLRNECRPCIKTSMRAWREANVDRLRAKDRQYSARPEVREATGLRNTAWRAANPHKRKAHYKFHRALKAGLVKPQPCWVCGQAAEAHHCDYSRPLDVVWLCRPHHKQTHALIQGQP